MYKIKATVINSLGDARKYPCHAAPNVSDPAMAVYDDSGFRTTGAETYIEPPYHMRNLMPKEWGTWPPLKERLPKSAALNVICPDVRTALVFRLEPFDLDDKGYSSNYFRRQMAILQRIIDNPGIRIEEIITKFPDKFERETIYPPLHHAMIVVLAEGLDALDYIKVINGQAEATAGGRAKFKAYKDSLTDSERKALKL